MSISAQCVHKYRRKMYDKLRRGAHGRFMFAFINCTVK